MPVAKKKPKKKPQKIPPLIVPDWVPDHVADKARELHRHNRSAITVALIERLANDPRMKGVWGEFAKRRRDEKYRSVEPFYRVAERFASKGLSQEAAVAGLFAVAVKHGVAAEIIPLNNKAHPFKEKADSLRTDAEQVGKIRPSRVGKKYAQRLRKAADVYDAIEFEQRDRAEAIAGEIAVYLQSFFESPKGKPAAMHKPIAVITSVITGRDITGQQVYNWLRALKR